MMDLLPRYYFFETKPVKLVRTKKGTIEALAYNAIKGEFERVEKMDLQCVLIAIEEHTSSRSVLSEALALQVKELLDDLKKQEEEKAALVPDLPWYFFFGDRPIKIVVTGRGRVGMRAYNWETGEFEGASYDTFLRAIGVDEGTHDDEEVTEEEFELHVKRLRAKLGKQNEVTEVKRLAEHDDIGMTVDQFYTLIGGTRATYFEVYRKARQRSWVVTKEVTEEEFERHAKTLRT